MEKSKHIERIFQEGLNDFQASPSSKVWKDIESKLLRNQPKYRLIPILWKIVSVAAILALFFSIGMLYQHNIQKENDLTYQQNNTEYSTELNRLQIRPTSYSFSSVYHQLSEFETDVNQVFNFDFNTNSFEPSASTKSVNTEGVKSARPIAYLASQIQKTYFTEIFKGALVTNVIGSDSKTIKPDTKKSLFDEIEEEEPSIALDDSQAEDKPWTVQPNVAPVFMNSLSGGNPLDPGLQGKTSSSPNLSFGINLSYAINRKIKIRTGVNQVAMGYNTQDVILSSASPASRQDLMLNNFSGNPNLSTNLSLISADSRMALDQGRPSSAFSPIDYSSTGVLNHEMLFLEVPLEIEYVIVDKKIGLQILGGASTFLLNDNTLSFVENGVSSTIGKAENINDFSLSANLGIGLDYNFSKVLSFNLEPKFKYQMNTFQTNASSFQPYFFGIYSGLKIKF